MWGGEEEEGGGGNGPNQMAQILTWNQDGAVKTGVELRYG